MRGEICEGLSGLGIELDPERNVAHNAGREGLISVDTSRVAVYVIPTNEELLIARDTVRGRERRPTAFLELGVSVWAFQIPGATQFVQGDVMRFRTHCCHHHLGPCPFIDVTPKVPRSHQTAVPRWLRIRRRRRSKREDERSKP